MLNKMTAINHLVNRTRGTERPMTIDEAKSFVEGCMDLGKQEKQDTERVERAG